MAHSSTDDDSITQSGASTPQNSPGDQQHLRGHQVTRPSVAPKKSTQNVPQMLHRSLYPPSSPPTVVPSVSSSMQANKNMIVPVNKNIVNSGPSSVSGNYMVNTGTGSSLVPPNVSLLAEINSLQSGGSSTPSANNIYQDEPRILIIETKRKSLGISFVGGNKTGIFVHRVVPDSLGESAGIRVGDQILEFNGIDLRVATAEHAYLEIAKPTDKVSVVVQHNMQSK